DGLGALSEDAVIAALNGKDEHVRERAVALAERLITRSGANSQLTAKLDELVNDESPRVRLQLAFTSQSSLALGGTLARLAQREANNHWISAALLSGPPVAVTDALLPGFVRDRPRAKEAPEFVAKLIEMRAASTDDRAALIEFVAQPGGSPLWLRAFGDGLRRAGTSIAQVDTEKKLAAVFARAAVTLTDGRLPMATRLEAIDLLAVAAPAQAREPLTAVLAPGQPEAVQVAAIKTLAQQPTAEVTASLVRAWPHYAPKAREAALAALMAREDRIVPLLGAVGAGKVAATDLSAAQVQSLAHHKTAKIAMLARTTLAAVIPPSRAEVMATFLPAVSTAGDATRGRALYLGRCMICHRAGADGMALGPDLITVKTKGREALLTAILDPHKEVAPQYIAYDVTTKDGNAYTGIIARDDATGLTLKIMGGAEVALPRANVKGSSSSGKSLMPEGLEAGLSGQDMADLLTFIEELK
ncbi:MAG: c-type cytochrome, partial [Opitutaceae bacterium]